MTGAPVPPGADAIVMVELTERDGDDGVLVQAAVPEGNHIRRVGEDVSAGDVVVTEGTVLTPAHIGVLASVGREAVTVRRPPRVGVLSTGDELVTAPAPLAFGQIRDSNRPMLLAEVAASGFEAVNLGTVRRRRGPHHRDHRRGRRLLRCGGHLGRGQRRRLRPHEAGPRHARRHAVDADRHPPGQALRLRPGRGHAGLRPARATPCPRSSPSSSSPARPCAR